MPDAPVPPEGVDLRAWVRLDETGVTSEVVLDPPAGVDPAFGKMVRRTLHDTRLRDENASGPGSGDRFCLLASFAAEPPAWRLRWLPGRESSPSSCLSGPLPTPREIARR